MNINIKSAVNGHKNCHFRPKTLFTLDFGRFQPVQYIEMIPGDDFTNIHGGGLVRVEPQVFPPFGRLSVKHATFFVPDYQLVNNASAFHAGKSAYQGVSTSLPRIKNYWLNALYHVNSHTREAQPVGVCLNPDFQINNSAISLDENVVTINGKKEVYDFAYTYASFYDEAHPVGDNDHQSGLKFYRLTPFGKKVFALFRGLGYDFAQYVPKSTYTSATFSDYEAKSSFYLSAMPLCAYLKVYCDYFVAGQLYDTSRLVQLSRAIYDRKDYYVGPNTLAANRVFNGSTMTFEIRDNWMQLIRELRVLFEDNLYTTAWNQPNSPIDSVSLPTKLNLDGIISPITSHDDTNFGGLKTLVHGYSVNYYDALLNSSNKTRFSALGHKALMAFDGYVRRRNLAGNNVVKQIYSIFGVTPSDKQFLMCSRIDTGQSSIRFNAVTSQSDTYNTESGSGAILGQYAGVGMGSIEINTKFRAETHGQLITLCWLNIDPIIERGNHPHVLRTSPNDYYNPEWDNNAIRPIPIAEIGGSAVRSELGLSEDYVKSTYGYTAIYDDYRNMRDIVCGSFLDYTGRNFAFMRDLTRIALKPQDGTTQYYEPFGASNDLTNPFIHGADAEDRFIAGIEWQIDCTRPVQDNDVLNIAKGDLSLTKNGNGLA